MVKRIILLSLILMSLLLLQCSCDDDGDGPTGVTAAQLTKNGWAKFDAGEYSGASADFKAAIGLDPNYKDAYLGLGWAELKQNKAGLAEEAFETYLLKSDGSNDDANAGLAFAYDAQDKYEDAIDKADQLLTANGSWSFSHDPSTNYLDVALVLAQGYYATAQFQNCLDTINEYFDSNFNVDWTTDQGRVQLADKLESLYTG